jgi:protein-S-isoprenylcysteine O-methyltransferase Ste14
VSVVDASGEASGPARESLVELPPDNPNLPIKPPYVFVIAMLIGFAVHWIRPVAARPDRWGGLGIIFCVLAVSLAGWAWLALKRHHTDVRPWKPTTAIVADGPFALSRNPIYLGFALFQVGVGLWADALAVVLLTIPAVAATNKWIIAREESYLTRKFGEQYTEYTKQARRWM